jgi:hypothetical protein
MMLQNFFFHYNRSAIITALIVLNSISARSQEISHEHKKQLIVKYFTEAVEKTDSAWIAANTVYPLRRDYPLPSIKNANEMKANFNMIFDDSLRSIIAMADQDKDWSRVGYDRGIMLHHGMVWLTIEGELLAVNTSSEAETKLRDQMIKADKESLHASLREFIAPVCILETKKFHIRIDDLGDGNYRYASWKIGTNESEKPDLVLRNGEYKPDGSGGNHSYIFRNGVYTYECAINRLRETGSAEATLIVEKGESRILEQDAVLK